MDHTGYVRGIYSHIPRAPHRLLEEQRGASMDLKIPGLPVGKKARDLDGIQGRRGTLFVRETS